MFKNIKEMMNYCDKEKVEIITMPLITFSFINDMSTILFFPYVFSFVAKKNCPCNLLTIKSLFIWFWAYDGKMTPLIGFRFIYPAKVFIY